MPARTKNLTPTLINKAYAELPKEWAILIDEMYVALEGNRKIMNSIHFDMSFEFAYDVEDIMTLRESIETTKNVMDKFDRKDWK